MNQQEHILTFGPFRLETASGRLWRQDEMIALRPRSLAMLQYLAERPGSLVTKAELLQQVWAGAHVSDDVLRASVRDIRRALGDAAQAPRYLETVGRQGYRFLQGKNDAPHPGSGPVVGRQSEVDQLQARFGRAAGGERQVVLLSGEPGIGKTTVVNLFLERMAERQGVRIAQGYCSLHYGEGEAYQPLLDALERLALAPDGSEVLSVLQRYAPMWLVQLPALVSGVERERLQRQIQGATQARMVREISAALEALAAQNPLILVLEDLHWSDVSTVEALAAIAQRPGPTRLFVLGTYRPADAAIYTQALRSVVQELRGRGQCHELSMELLSADEVAAYMIGRLGGAVSERLSRLISRCTEGNPLFMVNLVDHLAHQGALRHQDGQWTVAEEVATTMVPEGLRPLIMRRLEALTVEEKRALEVASVAGAEYATALVATGLDLTLEKTEILLESLAAQGHFIAAHGLSSWPDGTLSGRYRFQHALYQQTLYEQLGAARRAQLHLRLGNRLEVAYGERAHEMAAELAIHFAQSHDVSRAVPYLQQAGDQSLSRSTHREAIAHFTKGLALLPTLRDTPERARQELILLIGLGAALVVTQGYAAPEVAVAYDRARQLCQYVEETPEYLHVLWGLWSYDLVHGQLQTARGFAERYLRFAEHLGTPELVLEAHNMLGQTLSYLGIFPLAYRHAAQGGALYDTVHHPSLMSRYVRDPGVLCLFYQAWNLWFLGYPDQALTMGRDALAWARRLSHPFTLVAALYLMAWIHQLRREPEAVRDLAEAVITHCHEYGFALWLEQASVLHGWALAMQGRIDEGITEMRQGLSAYLETGARRAQVSFLLGLVEVYSRSGKRESGHACLIEALTAMDAHSEHWCESEWHRLRGELLMREHAGSPAPEQQAEIKACFQHALTVARGQQARGLELRAALSWCQLLRQQSRRQEALDLLTSVYDGFTEGFDTTDLRDAKRVLEALAD